MSFIKPSHSLRALLLYITIVLCLFPCLARGEETDDVLDLFSAFQEQTSTASRAPKPLSQTAENVTVITVKEIELLNAHTLADVLATVPGIQTDHRGGPGNIVFTFIQSTNYNHMLVLVDGVPLNDLADNFADVSTIPAQTIERIEILKGAASSAWGQALSGVINVTTKSPERGRAIGGSASASIGERTTADTRAELSGTSGKLGYYLSGGYLGSNGILPRNGVFFNDALAKLTYELPEQGKVWGSFTYNRGSRQTLFVPLALGGDLQQDQDIRNLRASIGVSQPLNEHLQLDLFGRHAYKYNNNFDSQISDGAALSSVTARNRVSGASAKLTWRETSNLLVIGGEYEHAEFKGTDILQQVDTLNKKAERWGIFLNDTLTLGPLAITPGVRFDHTAASGGGQFSPSLGATWQLGESTVLRAYTGRGFSLPSITIQNLPAEKIWSSQLGFETQAVPYLWLKGTLFRNEIWNIGESKERRIALGSELEVRTTPIYNTSLGGGWTYTDTYRTSDGSPVLAAPRHTLQLALRYDDKTYRGVLTGRHINWNSEPAFNGKYRGMLWDLHLGATLLKRDYSSLELFFSGHNLFNGRQYQDEWTPNTGRWFEGGMRVRF